MTAIDVVVPVYRGLEETRCCIESVLASTNCQAFELIVINDASPESELVAWLEANASRFTLLHNQQNLGFVGTVNRGMALHPERDVVLLNSDTEVHADWLDRLHVAAMASAMTGSVTPLSNNATICSYPRFCQDNPCSGGQELASLDHLCAASLSGVRVEIPTAVGFCMYIRRDCLLQSGLFDADRFGRGYGEENEFCMRSRQLGWRHWLAADVFVRHAGGVSFAETQSVHQQYGHRALLEAFPDYDRVIAGFVAADTVAPVRFLLDLARVAESGLPLVLLINHCRGGGTTRHVHELVERLAGQACFLMLQPETENGAVELGCIGPDGWYNRIRFEPWQASQLRQVLLSAGVTRVHWHHWIGLHHRFVDVLGGLDLPADVTLHDHYTMCPQVTLTDANGRYCGEPATSGCNSCLQSRPVAGCLSVEAWRHTMRQRLTAAQRVLVPSADLAQRLRRYFPDVQPQVAAHQPGLPQAEVLPLPLADVEPMRIVVLGALSNFKGPDVLEACALHARDQELPLRFHLLGKAYRELDQADGYLTVHGLYAEQDLPTLLTAARPHLLWFPGSCPETWSYTLSAALEAGLPVLATHIGAFAERLAGRRWTWLVAADRSPAEINAHFLDVRAAMLSGREPPVVEGDAVSSEFDYPRDYLPDDTLVRQPLLADILRDMRAMGLLPMSGR